MNPLIEATPWDTSAFGIPTWELIEYSEAALLQAAQTVGHYTLRVDPLVDKRLLHEQGFYYCDTLIRPHCNAVRLRAVTHLDATILKIVDDEHALAICHGAFAHGRFHRDFNLPKAASDLRYDQWLKQLVKMEQVYGLYWRGELAGFFGHDGNKLLLQALTKEYRGKGLSKYWWSAVCLELLSVGHEEITSSISATNLPVFSLCASLGFSFSNPQDIYHRMVS